MRLSCMPLLLLAVLLTGCAGAGDPSGNTTNASGNTNESAKAKQLPEFPWPPDASAFVTIPSERLVKQGAEAKLSDVDGRLRNALQKAGYEQMGYYHIPGGFVIVTAMEQFNATTGAPLAGANRWSRKVIPPAGFTRDYFRGLIKGNAGHFRVIAFAVTKEPFRNQSDKEVSAGKAASLVGDAATVLPNDVKEQPYSNDYQCVALIYEFLQPNNGPAQFVRSSGLLPSEHLQKILPSLEALQ